MMKAATLRDQSESQLIKTITELKKESLVLRMKRSQGDDIKVHRLREIRQTVARAMTVLQEKKKEAE